MKKILMALVVALPLAMACEATDETTDAKGGDQATTDQTPACTATAQDVYESCLDFRAALCDRLVECDIYATTIECGNWFDDTANGYGGCDPDFRDPLYSPANFQKCICDEIPNAPCPSLSNLENALPACYEYAAPPEL